MSFFDTDFHCHILPGIDDGAADLDVSRGLLQMQAAQGVRTVIATPHYRHHQQSVRRFLENRQAAYEEVAAHAFDGMPHILLAAEVALERNLSEVKDIAALGCAEMNTLLIELPLFESYHKWMAEEIEEISYRTRKQIMIAHLDRYVDMYSTKDYADILNIPDAIFQFNLSTFSDRKAKKLLKQLVKDEYPLVFGTDCHNLTGRKSNFDVLGKQMKKYEPSVTVERLFANVDV